MNITQEEALRRLNSPNNIANLRSNLPVEYRPTGKAGKERQQNIPEPIRDTIAALALENDKGSGKLGTSHDKIAEAFGVSRQVVTAAKSGRVGGKPANEDRAAKRVDREHDIKDTALTKLMTALGLLTPEKLDDLGAKDLAAVASQMTKVYSGLTPQVANEQKVQLVVYTPEMRDEARFKIIEVEASI